mgnify:CR=1 FL=1
MAKLVDILDSVTDVIESTLDGITSNATFNAQQNSNILADQQADILNQNQKAKIQETREKQIFNLALLIITLTGLIVAIVKLRK